MRTGTAHHKSRFLSPTVCEIWWLRGRNAATRMNSMIMTCQWQKFLHNTRHMVNNLMKMLLL